jgi:acyl-CoA thioesterase
MNLKQFCAVLEPESDAGGRTVLPAAHPTAEQIFGGQILAQLIAAAETGRTVKSLQIAFPRGGRPRGFGTGAVYTQAGSLVASFAQESVIRSFR